MDKKHFQNAGDRKNYTFNLVLNHGVVNNNISGSAVARDLTLELTNHEALKKLLVDEGYKFNMGKNFILNIAQI